MRLKTLDVSEDTNGFVQLSFELASASEQDGDRIAAMLKRGVPGALAGTGAPEIIRANSTDIYFGESSRNTFKINPSTNAVEFIISNAANSGPNGMCIDASNKVWVSTGYLVNRIDKDSVGWVRGHAWG